MIYDRKEKKLYKDNQYGGKYLKFLYETKTGRILLKFIINPIFSKIYGFYNNTKLSKNKIQKFIIKNNINIDEYEKKEYKSFNDFFTRKKVNLNFVKDKNIFISPASSKLTVYKITDDLKIKVKQSFYTLEELTHEKGNLDKFKNGNCLVFRLSMDDYHRFCHIDNGFIKKAKKINGKLHTVSSISSKHKVYSQNSRIVNFLQTSNFGDIFFIEVGALLVGKIHIYQNRTFSKGDEKGYFELGGSTIVILTDDKIKIDNDIIENSQKNIETKVEYGERIGIKC